MKNKKKKVSPVNNDVNVIKTVKLSDILFVLKDAGVSYRFYVSDDIYSPSQRLNHIEIVHDAFDEVIVDIWNNKIECINLNASLPEFSKIYHWAGDQVTIVNDVVNEKNDISDLNK